MEIKTYGPTQMDEGRLAALLDAFPHTRVLVVGDFFVDYYLDLDRMLSEISLETDLEAYQVVRVRANPGAAGTVTSNLCALDVQVVALGVIGPDGMGHELLRGLHEWKVETGPLIRAAGRFTPTYTKPMLHEPDGRIHELNRLDIKNRQPTPPEVEDQILAHLDEWIERVDGVIVADQVQEENCGVVTDRVRERLAVLALAHPERTVAVDSRTRIGAFRHVSIKPNLHEAAQALRRADAIGATGNDPAAECAAALYERNRRPVYLTRGTDGIMVFDQNGATVVPAIQVQGPIDIVGAGDSAMAGIVSALCCGATPPEAALVGNLIASITIQQIGTTGTATRAQVRDRHRQTRA